MPLPWIKMWLEALDDPKLTRLSLAERGAWWGILALAGKCNAEGKILSGGAGLDMDEIADALHIKTDEDRQALESMIAKMVDRGSLGWNEHTLTVAHWEERQRIPPSLRPEMVAERVRRYRERRKGDRGREAQEGECRKSDRGGEPQEGEAGYPVEMADLLPELHCLKHWRTTEDDVEWLQGFMQKYPEFSRDMMTACADYYSDRPAKHKGDWKNRLRKWVENERKFAKPVPRDYKRAAEDYEKRKGKHRAPG